MTTPDLVIVGGGPAGVSMALTAEAAGAKVAVLTRPRKTHPVGESLPPQIQGVLAELGIWEHFVASGHLPSYGIRSFWGDTETYDRSFIFDPHGSGWSIDRQVFDDSLIAASKQRGVQIIHDARLVACERDLRQRRWTLGVASPLGLVEFHPQCLVDATGRASTLSRRLGASRSIQDRLVGLYATLQCRSAEDEGTFAMIEAVDNGWWYSTSQVGGRLSIGFMTDADVCAQTRLWTLSGWTAHLKAAPNTFSRTSNSFRTNDICVVPSQSSHLQPTCGPGWLAVGDAAMTFDPLAGQGVLVALRSGIAAGRFFLDGGAWNTDSLADYAAGIRQHFERFLEARRTYYSAAARSHRFWTRRANLEASHHTRVPGAIGRLRTGTSSIDVEHVPERRLAQ